MDSLSACPSGARSTKGTTPRYCDCAALLNRNVFQIRFCRRSSARLAAVDPEIYLRPSTRFLTGSSDRIGHLYHVSTQRGT